jgi:hypothetical protein
MLTLLTYRKDVLKIDRFFNTFWAVTDDAVIRISNRTLRRVAVAYAAGFGRVGRVPGLDETRAAAVSHRLASCSNNSKRVGHHRNRF